MANNSFMMLDRHIELQQKEQITKADVNSMQRELELVKNQLAAASMELARRDETIAGLTTDLENALNQFERLNKKSAWNDVSPRLNY